MANPAACAMLGFGEDELRRAGRSAVLDADDPDVRRALEERRRKGRFRGELTMRRKNGTRIHVEVSSALFTDDQEATWTSMFLRDVSERRAQEAERERLVEERDAERRWYKTILDHVPLGIVIFEPRGTVSANRRAEEIFGMKIAPDAGSAQYASRLLFPDGTPMPHEQLVSSRVLRTGETVIGAEFLVERSDRTRTPILGSAAAIKSRDGKVLGAVGIFQDVSDRMKTEEAVRRSERLLKAIVELLPVGIWVLDQDGRVTLSNPASARVWDGAVTTTSADLRKRKGWLMQSDKPIASDEWAAVRALEKGETTVDQLVRIQLPDGSTKTIINAAMPLHDADGVLAGAVAVHQDVTRLTEAEEELRRAIRARDDVLGIVAHDLRNPLNGIGLQLRLMRRGMSSNCADVAIVESISRQVARMNRLVQDLLDVARMEAAPLSLAPSLFDVDRVARDVVEALQPLASAASVTIDVDVRDKPLRLKADPSRLAQALDNLIGNALKASRAGGAIDLRAERRGDEVCFSVRDRGKGIAPEHLPHLFDRFWQADPHDRRGAGLGLAIVKGIIDAHGGRVWAESTVGVGTTVYFTLPTMGERSDGRESGRSSSRCVNGVTDR